MLYIYACRVRWSEYLDGDYQPRHVVVSVIHSNIPLVYPVLNLFS
jgi:hypothetical protein